LLSTSISTQVTGGTSYSNGSGSDIAINNGDYSSHGYVSIEQL
jgi:hypothetical protein